MAKMKVYELAKEIDKHSKDIINYLKDQGIEVKSHMNSIEDSSVELVKKHFLPQGNKVENKSTNQTVSKMDTPAQPVGQNNTTGTNRENRPNSNYQGQGNRPNSNYQGQGNRPNNNYQGNRSNDATGQRSGESNYQGGNRQNNYNQNRPNNYNQSSGGYRQNRPMNSDGTRPSNSGERTGYQGNRPNNGTGYQGNSERTGYQGNRPNNGTGYQGNGERTGYQGNRPNNGTGYQGNRPNNGTGYQGNRPNNGTGYQGNRPNNGTGYQGNGERTGYQGNRPNNGTGYQGNRPNNGPGGNRPYGGGQGTGGNRPYGGGQGGGGYNRNGSNTGGYKSRGFEGMNKDDDKDADNKKRNFRSNDSKSDGKKFEAPLGMSRSDSVNNRNSRANKNAKPGKSNYGRKVIDKEQLDDDITLRKKGQFIKPKPVAPKVEEEVKVIVIPEVLTIKELADKMKLPASALVKKLFLSGKMVSINQEITFEEAEEIAIEYDIIAEHEVVVDVIEELLKEDEEEEENMEKRPPVVCVMGHVDHGKTSLLDAIRTTSVTSHEAGGITQHIGAYTVDVNGEHITFLDTPGHEAFTSMRMRGAKSTDIAILVVAADDGVMPQTVEAISHAKAAGIQIIVAVNKIDKPSANIERVKQELTEYELVAEDWGGDTIFVPVSAHTREGIEQLLEMIVLTSEILELKANPNRNARGIVIEAELDKGRGPVATILVQKGTLHVGDSIAIGAAYGKVRAMMDDKGRRVKEATPSTPVEILGLNEVPDAGEIFISTDTEKEARTISETYISQSRERLLADTKAKLSLDGLFSQIKAGNVKELNIIIKADVQGSVEAMKQSLVKLSNTEVAVRIIHGGVGAINESDVTLASASNAIIIGFNVRPDNAAKETADREKVDLRLYRVIYSAIEDVDAAMKGMLDPVYEEKVIGHAEVRQVFKASGLGTIAGSYVLDGKITRGCSARITREGKLVFEGALASLKRFKDDVKEVATGYECGLVFEKFNDINEFDQVELYVMQEVPRK